MQFTKKELQIISLGLQMYSDKLKKLMKDSEKLKSAEEQIKQNFLEVQSLIGRTSRVQE